MFCNQCEQTAKGTGCTVVGVCGKSADVAAIQDQLVYLLRRLAALVLKARSAGIVDTDTDDFMVEALFGTLTNVNFDPQALRRMQAGTLERAKALAARLGDQPEDLNLSPEDYPARLPESVVGIDRFSTDGDVASAMQLLLFGLKGVAAYADHAARLGRRAPALAALIGKALVSGHDLLDLLALLEQTEGTGINVYTHGEMLPAHGYPRLKAFGHLAGHYGTAWQNQQKELPDFPGAVLFTTNCIQNPRGYGDKVFTSGNVGWPGCTHCTGRDFAPVIARALELPGFAEDKPGKDILTGFGRRTMLNAAPKVLEAVAQGKLRHIFLVGGCDGAKPGRNYYTEFVEKTPQDTLVLTLACGKFRFFDKDLGKLGDLPRLLDMGQCNDAYAAVRTAQALAEALKCGVNDLPLSLVLSWYEQKAVSILLTLLALGIKNIRLGPSLPAFVSPNILNLLVEKWGIRPITTPDEDLAAMLK